jgi:hypothetical protein
MESIITPIQAITLTPFAYHSLMVQGGSATLPELIGDQALAFGLAATLGWMDARLLLPDKDYRRHLRAMPYRTSVLTTPEPRLLAPLTRRFNLDSEGGFQKKLDDVTRKGNLKTFFHTQEVPPDQHFYGAVFGFNPFAYTGKDMLVIRVGLHRNGMVALKPCDAETPVNSVRLNAATAVLFNPRSRLRVSRYCLHSLQLSAEMPLQDAFAEVNQWN